MQHSRTGTAADLCVGRTLGAQMEPLNKSALVLQLRRFGDSITYNADDDGLSVTGQHLFGSRYTLRFAYSELRPDYHAFWLKNSRQPVQLSLVLAFFVVFGLSVAAMRLVPRSGVALGSLTCLALLIAALLVSVFSTMGPLLFRSIPPLGPDRVTR